MELAPSVPELGVSAHLEPASLSSEVTELEHLKVQGFLEHKAPVRLEQAGWEQLQPVRQHLEPEPCPQWDHVLVQEGQLVLVHLERVPLELPGLAHLEQVVSAEQDLADLEQVVSAVQDLADLERLVSAVQDLADLEQVVSALQDLAHLEQVGSDLEVDHGQQAVHLGVFLVQDLSPCLLQDLFPCLLQDPYPCRLQDHYLCLIQDLYLCLHHRQCHCRSRQDHPHSPCLCQHQPHPFQGLNQVAAVVAILDLVHPGLLVCLAVREFLELLVNLDGLVHQVLLLGAAGPRKDLAPFVRLDPLDHQDVEDPMAYLGDLVSLELLGLEEEDAAGQAHRDHLDSRDALALPEIWAVLAFLVEMVDKGEAYPVLKVPLVSVDFLDQ